MIRPNRVIAMNTVGGIDKLGFHKIWQQESQLQDAGEVLRWRLGDYSILWRYGKLAMIARLQKASLYRYQSRDGLFWVFPF